MANFYESIYEESQTTQSAVDSVQNQEQTDFSNLTPSQKELREEVYVSVKQIISDLTEKVKTTDPVYIQSYHGEDIRKSFHDIGKEVAKFTESGLEDIKDQAVTSVLNYISEHQDKFEKPIELPDTVTVNKATITKIDSPEISDIQEPATTEERPEEVSSYTNVEDKYDQLVAPLIRGAEASHGEMADTWQNLPHKRQDWIDEAYSEVAETLGNVCDQAMAIVKDVTTDNAIAQAIIDLPATVGELMDTAILNPIDNFVNDVMGEVSSLIHGVSNEMMNIVDGSASLVGTWIDKGLDRVSGAVSGVLSDWKETVTGFRQSTLEGLAGLLGLSSPDGGDYRSFEYKVAFDRALKNYRKGIPNRTSYMNPSLEFRNEMYWDVTIVPFKDEDSGADPVGPPDLRKFFGIDSTDDEDGESIPSRLPIISFDLVGGTSVSTELEMYPGMSLSYPSQYNLPSRFSISLPEVIYSAYSGDSIVGVMRNVTSAIQEFKKEFLDWVYIGRNQSDASVRVRDFRKCAYMITVSAYSQDWRLAYKWEYLGIPEVSDSTRGSSSSSIMTTDIAFTIVGENYYE